MQSKNNKFIQNHNGSGGVLGSKVITGGPIGSGGVPASLTSNLGSKMLNTEKKIH